MSGFKDVVSTVAPFLGNMIGGPFGAAAATALSNFFFGKDDASEEEIQKALTAASPDKLVELKKIDADYKTRMAELGIDEQKVSADDRDSARRREKALKDNLPSILALLITFGFFGVLLYIMVYGTNESSHDVVNLLIGSLGTAWISIISYYFGSSAGSQLKTMLMGNKK